jgi:hypothetical protein
MRYCNIVEAQPVDLNVSQHASQFSDFACVPRRHK